MRKPWRFFSLNRPKLRQSWNKFNLYNIARAAGREPLVNGRATFFQQKWAAKAKTRAYHGEHIPEKKWVRQFSRRLYGAVEMPPEYLAANDGSEQAAGRGSGLSTSKLTAESYSKVPPLSDSFRNLTHPGQRVSGFGDVNAMLSENIKDMTPYMQMTYAPLERRLDTAIFRALFASSVRQARQFVLHGAVMVNGKKMVHPSYQLNPGDMFQVQIEKVLYGTGMQKPRKGNAELESSIKARKRADEKAVKELGKKKGGEGAEAKPADGETAEGEEAEADAEAGEAGLSPEDLAYLQTGRVRRLRKSARAILQGDLRNLSAKQKKELRLFRDYAQRFLSLPEDAKLSADQLVGQLQSQIETLQSVPAFRKEADPEDLVVAPDADAESLAEAQAEGEQQQQKQQKQQQSKELTPDDEAKIAKKKEFQQRVLERGLEGLKSEKDRRWAHQILATEELTNEEVKRLAQVLKADAENPVDESKPYLTPWRPRPYMSAFAFVPRYLEVNPNICAAVYLRHPVARKGMAEVPTPFSYLTNQLTHNWYLGRG